MHEFEFAYMITVQHQPRPSQIITNTLSGVVRVDPAAGSRHRLMVDVVDKAKRRLGVDNVTVLFLSIEPNDLPDSES